MGAARLTAVAGSQTASKHSATTNAVAGYQTACTNARFCPAAVAECQTAYARGCPAAVAGSQTASLSKGRANMQQQ
jgi:hypothetical protein